MLSPLAREAAKEAGLGETCTNPFRSIVVRAVEVLYACDEALRIIEAYQEPDQPHLDLTPRAGVGYACTEAPRGMLYHRYRLDADGTIVDAKIVPPTSQNQPSIEDDLKTFAGDWLDMPEEALRVRCEQAVRNHDPCISCATHFLKLEVVRVVDVKLLPQGRGRIFHIPRYGRAWHWQLRSRRRRGGPLRCTPAA